MIEYNRRLYILWEQDMEKIILFTDSKRIIKNTYRITEGKYELIWRSYRQLYKNEYQCPDAVVMHFDHDMLQNGIFELIIKVKGRVGNSVPILAIIEGGTPQDIFSILQIGVYDYIETTDNLPEYQKKIKDLILWSWYLKTYEYGEKDKD